jgi:D-glycero-alpha-D-manno-heptose-7-phosphate kinase
VELAGEAKKAMEECRLDDFGALLHEAWLSKKKLASGVSNSRIDQYYSRALEAGARGGKILGAGGGGFLLLYADEAHQEAVRKALAELRQIPFAFEPQGSKIIYVED